ncbi:hypothetical protein Y032_0526g2934 [Ancylostoma ceylanicum]|uniref:Integrase zinc-binding domain-containing protein n=1 Tax=Ancylostoma ceylanicum TaxID=53326 RepID=A0A016WTL1_9BILA|nr:hypothetical protein Y032_0526g2934 [Ancylostoma ceylanicum]
MYRTNITKDIEDYVRGCRNCQEVAKAPLKTELFSWPNEKQPWSRVHIDYAGPLNGMMFLVIVDAHSKWSEIIEMTSTTSAATIRQLTRLFASSAIQLLRCPTTEASSLLRSLRSSAAQKA